MNEPRLRLLDELGAEFARVAAERERGRLRRTPPRLTATLRSSLAIAAVALLITARALYSVPATRAAIEDVTSAFRGWLGGDERQAPGRPVSDGDNAPSWVRAAGGRLIAEGDGVALHVVRSKSDGETVLSFSLGGEASGREVAIAGFNTLEGWRKTFDEHRVVVLGALPPRTGDPDRFPLIGVTARSVDRVELRYASGPPLAADNLDGGFVLLADRNRSIQEIVAFSGGQMLEQVDVSDYASP